MADSAVDDPIEELKEGVVLVELTAEAVEDQTEALGEDKMVFVLGFVPGDDGEEAGEVPFFIGYGIGVEDVVTFAGTDG